MAVESTLLGIIPVAGSELLDVQFQRWWVWKAHPVPRPILFSLLGAFLALLYQQQSSLLHCWNHVEPPGFSSLVLFWQVEKKKGISCLSFCKGRGAAIFLCIRIVQIEMFICNLYQSASVFGKKRIPWPLHTEKWPGNQTNWLQKESNSCLVVVVVLRWKLVATYYWLKLLLILALAPI